MTTQTTEAVLQALLRLVHGDPALRARLFALDDAGEFVAAVRHLAQSHGFELAEDALWQAMKVSQRAWLERRLP